MYSDITETERDYLEGMVTMHVHEVTINHRERECLSSTLTFTFVGITLYVLFFYYIFFGPTCFHGVRYLSESTQSKEQDVHQPTEHPMIKLMRATFPDTQQQNSESNLDSVIINTFPNIHTINLPHQKPSSALKMMHVCELQPRH